MSSAPRALRGAALLEALKELGCDEPPAQASAGATEGPRSAVRARIPRWTPVPASVPEEVDSGGPPALRPAELARWLEERG